MDSQKIFIRQEKKYLISKEQKDNFLKDIEPEIVRNRYFFGSIRSLYFDTENDDFIIKSIEKPEFKEKIRLRGYGEINENSTLYFEIKTKCKGFCEKVTNKRRFELSFSDYCKFINGKVSLFEISESNMLSFGEIQTAKEIDFIFHHYNCKPKIVIMSDRESYDGKFDNNLRITFDENLRYETNKLDFRNNLDFSSYFEDKEKNIILEIKSAFGLPLKIVKAMNKYRIFPESFSKYGMIYKKIQGAKYV